MDFTFFGGKYRLEEELAIGGCGTVFVGTHTIAGKSVAIKLEPCIPIHNSKDNHRSKSRLPYHPSPLLTESRIYKSLSGGPGVPYILWSGKRGDFNVLIVDLLGPSLEDLFKMCNKCFSLRTVLLLADQLISRIQYIHSRDFVHRDIKPANFVMGVHPLPSSRSKLGMQNSRASMSTPSLSSTNSSPSVGASGYPRSSSCLVNIIDFGLAKKYRDPITGTHIPYKQDPHHGVGTSLFASINTHFGCESSRRDDLESLAYMLIYFLLGHLPWRRLRGSTVAGTWDLILKSKLECESLLTVGLPEEFETFRRYARGLEFDDEPDYEGLRNLFRSLGTKTGIDYDSPPIFDWSHAPRGKLASLGRRGGSGRVCEACTAGGR